jgi:hypothetical protein
MVELPYLHKVEACFDHCCFFSYQTKGIKLF